MFHAHFGSDPLDLANMWYDISTTSIENAQRAHSRPPVLPPGAKSKEVAGYDSKWKAVSNNSQPLLIISQLRDDYEQSTMVDVGNLAVIPAAGASPVPTAPQLPFAADPGTITGWLLDATTTETSGSISRGLELGFNRLVDNVPDPGDATYDDVMCTMTDEIISSNTLVTYLVVTNAVNNQA
jgi:hypothetical protein